MSNDAYLKELMAAIEAKIDRTNKAARVSFSYAARAAGDKKATNVQQPLEEAVIELLKRAISGEPRRARREWRRHRSAITGRFVAKAEAESNPNTTVTENN